ncbi:MAG: porin family protein, partial [Bacteroidota bacterium]
MTLFSKFLLACFVLATSIHVDAQTAEGTDSDARFKIGIALGLNAPTLISSYTDPSLEPNSQLRPAYHFGITTDYVLNKKYALGGGVFLSSKGYSNADLSGDDMERFTIDYIEIPIQFNYHFYDRFRLSVGPYFALGLGGDNYGRIDGIDVEKVNYVPKSGDVSASDLESDEIPFRLFDFGLSLGIGYQVYKNFSVQIGYSRGLISINNTIVGNAVI